MVKINGQQVNAAGMTVLEYVTGANYDTTRIAVEINGDIVPKALYGDTFFKDEDTVEVVSFVGGG